VNLVVGMGITGRGALLAGMSGLDPIALAVAGRMPVLAELPGAAIGPSSGSVGRSVTADRGGGTRVLDPPEAIAGSEGESIPLLHGRFCHDDEPSRVGTCSYLELGGTYRLGGVARVGS
jgi:hypothetical protein